MILVHVTDLHINSTIALYPPSNNLDDGGTHGLSKAQWWLWHKWEDFVSVYEQASRQDDIILIVGGDKVDFDFKSRSTQYISRNPADVIKAATDVIEPLVNIAKQTYFIRGTGSHVGQSAHIEETIASDLEGVKDPETGASSWWHLPLIVDGVTFDIAHHTTGGGLPWTKKNAVIKLAAKVMFEYMLQGKKPPDIILREHIHQWGDSNDAYPSRAIVTPSWKLGLHDEYVQKIQPGAISDIGATFIKCKNGSYKVFKLKYEPRKESWITAK